MNIHEHQAKQILKKYGVIVPDGVFALSVEEFVEKAKNCELDNIDKKKFLVPNDLTMSQFIYIIRKRIKIKPEQAIFLTVNNCLPESNAQLVQVYNKHKYIDGFLYDVYSSETTFG